MERLARKNITPLHRAVESGDLTEAIALINDGADVNAKVGGRTLLHVAVECGHAVMVAALIRAGADVNAHGDGNVLRRENRITPLHIAVRYGNIAAITALVSAGADVNAEQNSEDSTRYWHTDFAGAEELGATPLHGAKTADVVHYLVSEGANIDAQDAAGLTPLHCAISRGNMDVVVALIHGGADININACGYTPLRQAVAAGRFGTADAVSLLIKSGAWINAGNPLHEAVSQGRPDAVATLVRAGANVRARDMARDMDGATPLHIARDEKVVAMLIGAKANVNAKDNNGDTPLHRAVFGDESMVAALIKAGADVNAQNKEQLTPMDFAIAVGDKDAVAMLAEAGAHDKGGSTHQDTRLHMESLWGSGENIPNLIKAGADVNARGKHLATPLHRAASRGREDDTWYDSTISKLIEAGADVNAKDDKQRTPLDLAILGCHYDAAKRLREAGAVVNTQDDRQDMPLHHSFVAPDEVSAFIDGGADVNARDEWGRTLLHTAKSADVVALLAKAGADVNAREVSSQQTPLHSALFQCEDVVAAVAVVTALIRAGADVNAKDGRQRTPLHRAASGGYADAVPVLIEAGADVNARDESQETPLHTAVSKGGLATVAAFIKAGADVNAQNADNAAPLHLAADKGDLEMVVALINGGANVNIEQGIYRITTLFLAKRRRHKDVVDALEKADGVIITPLEELLSDNEQRPSENAADDLPAPSAADATPADDENKFMRINVRVGNETANPRHFTLSVAAGQLLISDENDSGEVKIKDGGKWRAVTGAVAITPDTVLMLGEYEVLARDLLARYAGALVLFGESSGARHDARDSEEGGIRRNPETGEIEGR